MSPGYASRPGGSRRRSETCRWMMACLVEIVDHQQRVAALVTEVLGDGAGGVRRDPLQARRIVGAGHHEDAAVHAAFGARDLDEPAHGGGPLPDGDVHADHVGPALVEDCVEGDRGLAGAAIADHQLALPATERDHGVDDEHAGVERLGHQIPVDDRRRRPLDGIAARRGDRWPAVERAAQGIDDATEHRLADRHADDLARPGDLRACRDGLVGIEQHRAEGVAIQGHGHAPRAAREEQHQVRKISRAAPCSWKGGGSRWIAPRGTSAANAGPSSTGSPRTLTRRPSIAEPTGTRIGPPVRATLTPRRRPEVTAIATVRTVCASRCWCTSTTRRRPSSANISSASLMAGSSPPGNATSTTVPRTRTTRPLAGCGSSIRATPRKRRAADRERAPAVREGRIARASCARTPHCDVLARATPGARLSRTGETPRESWWARAPRPARWSPPARR